MEFFGSKTTALTWKTMKIQKFQSIEKISLDSFGGGMESFRSEKDILNFRFFFQDFIL